MDFNEMDDYGTGWEEMAERKWEEMIDSQIREIAEPCPCYTAGTDSAITALLTGKCPICRG
jgi:hypothetical protein